MTRSIQITRRFALSAAAVTALAGIGLLGSSAAMAQAYPSKPVTIVVPSPQAAPPTSWPASSARH